MSHHSPPETKLDLRDYLLFPDDGRRHELVGGEHIVNPAPNLYHQTISRRILVQLYELIEATGKGEVFDAPTDVELSERDVVQPDLIVVLNDRRQTMTPARIVGPPNLVIEILSPSSIQLDRDKKRKLYQSAGVLEYWIVDPDQREVEQWVLEEGVYRLLGAQSESITATILPGVEVQLAKVW